MILLESTLVFNKAGSTQDAVAIESTPPPGGFPLAPRTIPKLILRSFLKKFIIEKRKVKLTITQYV